MRRKLHLWIGIGIVAALSAGAPGRATIVDTGDVVLSGNDLVIGNTADGSRTVDAENDGPYDSATLGAADGVFGALTLDHAAGFTASSLSPWPSHRSLVEDLRRRPGELEVVLSAATRLRSVTSTRCCAPA